MSCYNATCPVPMDGIAATTFASAVQFFAAAQCLATVGILPEAKVKNFARFDFIIVGAGTTGCVLANRLSERKDFNVLLIEAGGDPPIESTLPGYSVHLWKGKYTWGHQTTPNDITNHGNINGSIDWVAGKVIGGSSNINAMVYMQGNDHDYQRWNSNDWQLTDVRRCFRKAENFQDMNLSKYEAIKKHYGHDGPLVINTFNTTNSKEAEDVLSAFNEMGIKTVLDLNVANSLGSGKWRVTASGGERNSISKAYLKPVKGRNNLKIIKNSLATKILIDSSKKAYGVLVERNCKNITFFATKEIIISAGSANTPKLLMLSGVGPKAHLKSKGIPTIMDLPMVGQHLKSHCAVPITIYVDEPHRVTETDRQFDVIKYYFNRTGYLSQHTYLDIFALFSLDKRALFPDIQTYVLKSVKGNLKLGKSLTDLNNFKDVVVDSIVDLNKKFSLYIFSISQLHPNSDGNISLLSRNPKDPPIIYANYFENARDLEIVVGAVERILSILDTTYFKSVKAFLGRIKLPKCNKFNLGSSNYWKCICINLVGTLHHAVGSCKMGSSSNNSVVSSRLKVHGVRNLRVIDASVMPNHISGNTNAACVMIGERGAELIKQDYK